MRELEIRLLGSDDVTGLSQWHAVHVAAEQRAPGGACPWWRGQVVTRAANLGVHEWAGFWLGVVDGQPVVAGSITLPLADNLDLAVLEVFVAPRARHQGHGGAMLALLEEEAAARGRRIGHAEVRFPMDGPESGVGHPAVHFMTSRGWEMGLADVQRRVSIPIDETLLEGLAEEAAARHPAYGLVSFTGPVPEEYAEGYAALAGSLLVEAPQGDLALEAENPTVEVMRSREQEASASGLTTWHTLAVTGDGEVAAYSTIFTSTEDTSVGYQWGTLVAPAHRGHRLGIAVKVANHRQLQAGAAPVGEIATWNAGVNDHMIAINERLGFRPVERNGEFQKQL